MTASSRTLALALAILCFGGLFFPRQAGGHGAPDDAMHYEASIVIDSRFVEVTAEIDLPLDLAVSLRNQLDADGDYQVRSPDEQQKLLWLLQGEGRVRLGIDGEEVVLAPLYNPRMMLSILDSAYLEGRGKVRASWFGHTPATIEKGSVVAFSHGVWPEVPAMFKVAIRGRDGLTFGEEATAEKTFEERDERRFDFTVVTGLDAKAVARAGGGGPGEERGEAMVPANAVQIAEALATNHSYLVPEDRRASVADIHRRLRMGIQKAQDGGWGHAGNLTALNRASAELVAVLEKCEGVVRVDLEKDGDPEWPPRPVDLPGDTGAFLVRLNNGSGTHHGRVYSYGFDTREFREPMDTGTLEKGTTWLFVKASEVSGDPTVLKLALRSGEGAPVVLPLRLRSPEPARLKVTVLSDDTGDPVPSMVSLRWKTCNLDRRPSTALDIVPQFSGQGRQTNMRTPRLPGIRGKNFWVVPEPFEMELPPGEWEVVVRRGVERATILDTFYLRPGERAERTYRPGRWIDMPGKGWYAGDDHVHCRIMSDADAEKLMAYVRAEDIYLANVVKMGDINRTFFPQRGFGIDYRVTDGVRVLSPGQECPRTHKQLGHTLAMNTTAFVRDTGQYYLYDTVFDEVHRQGGLSGYAHVNRDLFFVHRDMSMNIPRGKVDFGEILQFGNLGTELYYEFLNLGYRFTASAGSDLPWGGSIGEVRVYAHLGEKEFSADRWFEAFGNGNTFVTNGPMLELEVDGALPGDTLELDRDRPVRVRARLFINPELGADKLELVAHGEVIEEVAGDGAGDGEIALDATVPVKGGLWLALRGKGADGSVAHTTPVYVVREGLRFWKVDEVEGLIEKRLGNLEEIEAIVANARQEAKEGRGRGLAEVQELARQGDALLERVKIAKDLYAELRETLEREKGLR